MGNIIVDALKKAAEIKFQDASQEGYEAGEKRASEGKSKNHLRTWTETDLKTKAKFIVQGDSAIDSWDSAYKKGYDGTMEAKIASDVSQTQPIKTETANVNYNFKNSNNMGGKNNLTVERQLELLYQLLTSLERTKEQVLRTAGSYGKMYSSLQNTMLRNTLQEYQENYERTIKNIKKLVDEIDSTDIPFIKREITWWESR